MNDKKYFPDKLNQNFHHKYTSKNLSKIICNERIKSRI